MLRPDMEPRATLHIGEIIEMVEALIARGHAYVADDGDVLFSVASFPEYGKLSGQNLEQLQAGARVEVDEHKRDPMDFVLWKMSKPGEPTWDSPWGPGRPGWHIECSAMNSKHLDCISISMAAAAICSFRIMKMKSPSLAAPTTRLM